MTGIYIASTTGRSGKSLLSFSIGVMLQRAGLRVGYMKPVGRLPQKKDELPGDADALVVQEILGQNAPPDVLTPIMIPENLHALAVREQDSTALDRVAACYAEISANKDVTLVSGTGSFPSAGRFADVDGFSLLRRLDLKVLLVERLDRGFGFNYDQLLLLKDILGSCLLGIVLNDVREQDARDASSLLCPWLEDRGMPVFAILPHTPDLTAMRVLDIAHGLEGRVVAGSAHSSRMVDDFLIGTMQVDNFMMYLRRREGCAVIVGGDRADLQLAALYANSSCIILTGNIPPSELIRAKAEKLGVTLVVVKDDTYRVAREMARILKSKKIHDLKQIQFGLRLVEQALDLTPLLAFLPGKALA